MSSCFIGVVTTAHLDWVQGPGGLNFMPIPPPLCLIMAQQRIVWSSVLPDPLNYYVVSPTIKIKLYPYFITVCLYFKFYHTRLDLCHPSSLRADVSMVEDDTDKNEIGDDVC